MVKKKAEVLRTIIEGVTACYRATYCTCTYREVDDKPCDHCRIRNALTEASNYVADCRDVEGG